MIHEWGCTALCAWREVGCTCAINKEEAISRSRKSGSRRNVREQGKSESGLDMRNEMRWECLAVRKKEREERRGMGKMICLADTIKPFKRAERGI